MSATGKRSSKAAHARNVKTRKRRERRARARLAMEAAESATLPTSILQFTEDHPGHPLGVAMPTGSTLREDGESHREAWMRILRADPCVYCGEMVHYNQQTEQWGLGGGTVDHVVPRDPTVLTTRTCAIGQPLFSSKWSWINLAGACERCNGSKASRPLLWFMTIRRGVASRRS